MDRSFDRFYEIINKLYCDSFPLVSKQVSEKRSSKPWLTHEILQLIKLKGIYFKYYKQGLISKETNNMFKNKVNREISRAKNSFYLNCFRSSKNSKESWKLIRELMGYERSGYQITNCFENKDSESILQTVNKFNHYFANIGDSLNAHVGSTIEIDNSLLISTHHIIF